ncbi:MAG: hypothetical protein NC080_11440 [Paraprevotella sp.]|nr:hypothetical protein [Paraprevotella sp.]
MKSAKCVVLPLDSMLYVADDSIGYVHDVMADRYRLVVYYDSTECSSCRLKTLYEWDSLIDSVSSSGHKVDFYFVFNVPTQRVEEVKAAIVAYASNLSVYLDTTGVFERMNPNLPRLSQMRTFLLNRKDTVVLVGNPVYNSRVADMMWNIERE